MKRSLIQATASAYWCFSTLRETTKVSEKHDLKENTPDCETVRLDVRNLQWASDHNSLIQLVHDLLKREAKAIGAADRQLEQGVLHDRHVPIALSDIGYRALKTYGRR